MLRFLADGNFPGNAIKILLEKGYNIKWIGNFAAGSSDEEVLEIAMKEERILITFDFMAAPQNPLLIDGLRKKQHRIQFPLTLSDREITGSRRGRFFCSKKS
ncbi:MAG: DUF5615 family PIN-like protein [Acidobacteria bacterium]|jgi:hypothetical protein|nr:DUF5615 family PIN-like protein [Acidobacteriota bacterium]